MGSNSSCTQGLPLDPGREGRLQGGQVFWRGGTGLRMMKWEQSFLMGVSITLTSSGTWGKDRVVPREICLEKLRLEESKASTFSSVLADVWTGPGYTLEACFLLRLLMPVLLIKSLFDLTLIRMAAIKKPQKGISIRCEEIGNLVRC